MQKNMNSVVSYYKNRSVFITGATGFLGKVLVEKLLRSCNGIENIYLLIRPSERASPEKRLQQLLQSSIFNHHKTIDKEFSKKLKVISGDITEDRLGISNENWDILSKNVSVVFHVAASIKFNMSMNAALKLNLEGTRNVLSLSKSIKNLNSMVYVSTAFSMAEQHKTPMEEIVYPARFDTDASPKFFDELEQLGVLDSITPRLLNGKPNTYLFSKHLTENLVLRKSSEWNLPTCIVRPSIVGPIYNDPVQLSGWVDNLHGVTSVYNAVGHGFTYVSPGGQSNIIDIIPVDYVAKIIILAAWNTAISTGAGGTNSMRSNNSNNATAVESKTEIGGSKETDKCTVYNACVDQFSRMTHGEFNNHLQQSLNTTPFSFMIRPPSVKVTEGSWWSLLNSVAVGVPCIIMDLFAKLNGRKARLTQTFKASEEGSRQIAFFRCTQFEFNSDNVRRVLSRVPAYEKEEFDLNMEEIKWAEYIQNGVLGLRRYQKDDDSTIPAALKNLRRIRRLYTFVGIAAPLAVIVPLCIFCCS